jgi:autophagy-related protein 18
MRLTISVDDGARGTVEMLFCTSLIALVGAADQPQSSPRKLQIVNTKVRSPMLDLGHETNLETQRQSMICELLFPSSILAVKMNRKTLVIVLEAEIYIYDISNMRLLHVIETTPNPDGKPSSCSPTCDCIDAIPQSPAIVALSPNSDNSYLAYPSPVPSPTSPLATGSPGAAPAGAAQQSGDVLLFSTRSLTVANVVQAHKAPIAFLALNGVGSLLATASERGTVIRVWSVPGAEKLYQLRRGTSPARIHSIAFNAVSSLLAVSSAHDTVHIFKLGPHGAQPGSGSGAPGSPSGSMDSREGSGAGGYDAFIDDKKKNSSMTYVLSVGSVPRMLTAKLFPALVFERGVWQ